MQFRGKLSRMQVCPYCGCTPPAKYKYFLDDLDISVLLKLWQAVIEQGINKIDVRNMWLSYGERSRLTQLRFHALITKVKNEKGKHIPATWLITKRGVDFLHGRIVVPAYVVTQDNKVIDHASERVHRRDFKILKDFQATYEIVGSKIIKLPMKQLSLII